MPVAERQTILDLRHGALAASLAVLLAACALAANAPHAFAPVAALMAAVLVLIAATDLERRVIPNRLVLPAAALILCARVAIAPHDSLEFVVAALAAAAVLLLPSVFNRSLVGAGDAKLALLIGAGLGWQVAGALTLAFLASFPVALIIVIRGGFAARKTALPFGPFLAFGALVFLIAPLMAGS